MAKRDADVQNATAVTSGTALISIQLSRYATAVIAISMLATAMMLAQAKPTQTPAPKPAATPAAKPAGSSSCACGICFRRSSSHQHAAGR